jgi:hypothetical protein
MNEVITFPINKIVREYPQNIELLEKVKEKSVRKFADDVIDILSEACYDQIEALGLDTEDEMFQRDFSFVVEIIRATVYRNLEMPHHLHEFIDNNLEISNPDSDE